MLAICTWLWGKKYSETDVLKLFNGVKRNLKQPFKFILFTDRALGHSEIIDHGIPYPELTKVPGCFVRLQLFNPLLQENINFVCGGMPDRIVNMDLDSVVTGYLDPVFDRRDPFLILMGANAANPNPYNGSLFMLRPGAYPEIWSDFSLEKATADDVPKYEFHDDQGWIWHKVKDAGGWDVGASSGVYAFQKPGWPAGETLPKDARLVVFPGWRNPGHPKFAHVPWIKQHWR